MKVLQGNVNSLIEKTLRSWCCVCRSVHSIEWVLLIPCVLCVLQYLHDTLDATIKMLLDPNIDCEVDPMKIQCLDNLAANQKSLLDFVHLVWYRIVNTQQLFPRYIVLSSFCYIYRCFAPITYVITHSCGADGEYSCWLCLCMCLSVFPSVTFSFV